MNAERDAELIELEGDYAVLDEALTIAKWRWPDSDRIEELEAWLAELVADRLILMEMADAR